MFASVHFGVKRKMLNIFVKVRGWGDRGEEIWVAKLLLYRPCFVKGDAEGRGAGFCAAHGERIFFRRGE